MSEQNYLRWLGISANVLNEQDPQLAQQLLVTGLLETFNAYTGARVQWTHNLSGQSVVFSATSLTEDTEWTTDLRYTTKDHPLLHFHTQTNNYRPQLLSNVLHDGWPMTADATKLFTALNLSAHQLSIPLKTSSHVTLYGLVSEDVFEKPHVRLATQLQPVIAAIDRRVQLLTNFKESSNEEEPADVELTAREELILRMIADGSTVAGMAARLSVSPRTVHKHQEHLYRKLGAKDRLSAVLRAQQTGHLKSLW